MAKGTWVRARALSPERKAEVTAACEGVIAGLRARYLPVARPAALALPIDIHGRWRGESYTFAVRFRSRHPDAISAEYHIGRFSVLWLRHTGRWWLLQSELTLEEALGMITSGGVLRPPV